MRAAECAGAPAAIVEKTAIPSVPPISWPVELRPEIIPAPPRAAGQDRDRDRDDGEAEAESGDEHPREDIAEIGAVFANVGEEGHAAGSDRER